jgi:hypothetical protein
LAEVLDAKYHIAPGCCRRYLFESNKAETEEEGICPGESGLILINDAEWSQSLVGWKDGSASSIMPGMRVDIGWLVYRKRVG